MEEKNLDVTTYRNGDTIPEVKDHGEWQSLRTGAWCYYNNDPENGKIYGKLYNWYAVNDPRGLAPEGWHFPTFGEWKELIDLVGEENRAEKIKEPGTAHWSVDSGYVTNETGFTALPAGYRSLYPKEIMEFSDINNCACWWSSTDDDSENAYCNGYGQNIGVFIMTLGPNMMRILCVV